MVDHRNVVIHLIHGWVTAIAWRELYGVTVFGLKPDKRVVLAESTRPFPQFNNDTIGLFALRQESPHLKELFRAKDKEGHSQDESNNTPPA